MEIDRKLWVRPFTKSNFPSWVCSTCGLGLLELQEETLHSEETSDSIAFQKDEAWDPDFVRTRFVAILKCNNKNCSDCVTVLGRGEVFECHDDSLGGTQREYYDMFFPSYFSPPPQIFKIPEKTPEDVRVEILNSFSVFLSDPNAAGNRVRACVEKILDHKKVKKTKLVKGKRVRLKLHSRIIDFQKNNIDLGDNLLAIKWLGNDASHSSGLTVDDIFDAFEILNYVLKEVYGNNKKKVTNLTSRINTRKGKLSK